MVYEKMLYYTLCLNAFIKYVRKYIFGFATFYFRVFYFLNICLENLSVKVRNALLLNIGSFVWQILLRLETLQSMCFYGLWKTFFLYSLLACSNKSGQNYFFGACSFLFFFFFFFFFLNIFEDNLFIKPKNALLLNIGSYF